MSCVTISRWHLCQSRAPPEITAVCQETKEADILSVPYVYAIFVSLMFWRTAVNPCGTLLQQSCNLDVVTQASDDDSEHEDD